MPLSPNFVERLLFFTLNQGPAPLLDLFGAVAFRATSTAIKLGVFDVLEAEPLSSTALARRLDMDEHGAAVLLEVLAAYGYLTAKDGMYSNSAMASKWLARSSPTTLASGFAYWDTLLTELFPSLDKSLRDGTPPVHLYEWIEEQPETSREFQQWMVEIAALGAEEVIGKIKVPSDARRVLDVGGGHGMYSIALCQRYPELSATIIDSPRALASARENVAMAGLEERITLQEGDFLHDDLGQEYDVVLLFNIVHGCSWEQNRTLLRRVYRALREGGLVVILEQLEGGASTPAARAATAVLGLSYFHLLGGQLYSQTDIASWLGDIGFSSPEHARLLKSPGVSLLQARKEPARE